MPRQPSQKALGAGWKVTILLEELGVGYNLHPVSIFQGEQKEEWFTKFNPNQRIPALGKYTARGNCICPVDSSQDAIEQLMQCQSAVDHEAGDIRVFESGAIMWYLAMKHQKFFPQVRTVPARHSACQLWPDPC